MATSRSYARAPCFAVSEIIVPSSGAFLGNSQADCLGATEGVVAEMSQTNQQQNGVRDSESTGDAAKLHLPSGEIIELPMLVVCHTIHIG